MRARELDAALAARRADAELDDLVRELLDDVVAGLERRLAAELRMDACGSRR